MIIKQLAVKEFGKFKDRVIELHPNMSLVYGQEDSGKTTLLAFIRCMLYGMETADRCYIAKETGQCSGSIILETGEKVYQIERDFIKDTILLKDVSTGQDIANPEIVLPAIMAGVSREDFDCVFGLRQQKVTYNDVNNLRSYADAVQKRISGSHLDEQIAHLIVEVDECRAKIDPDAQKRYEQCAKQMDSQREDLEKAQRKLEELKQEVRQQEQKEKDAALILDVQRRNLKEPLRKSGEEIDQCNQGLHHLKLNLRGKKPTEGVAVYFLLLFLVSMIGLAAYMMGFRDSVLLAAGVAGSVIGLIGYFAFSVYYNRSVKRWNQYVELNERLKDNTNKKTEIERQLKQAEEELLQEQKYLEELSEQLASQSLVLDEEKERALDWKRELNECSADLRQNEIYEEKANDLMEKWRLLCENRKYAQLQMNRVLMNMASWYLSMFTNARYDALRMDETEHLTIVYNGEVWNLEYMGQGTIAMCALCIQLAVADIVWKSNFIPIVMDETLNDFSDFRIKNIIQVLKKNGRQVILLSGHQNCLEIIKQ